MACLRLSTPAFAYSAGQYPPHRALKLVREDVVRTGEGWSPPTSTSPTTKPSLSLRRLTKATVSAATGYNRHAPWVAFGINPLFAFAPPATLPDVPDGVIAHRPVVLGISVWARARQDGRLWGSAWLTEGPAVARYLHGHDRPHCSARDDRRYRLGLDLQRHTWPNKTRRGRDRDRQARHPRAASSRRSVSTSCSARHQAGHRLGDARRRAVPPGMTTSTTERVPLTPLSLRRRIMPVAFWQVSRNSMVRVHLWPRGLRQFRGVPHGRGLPLRRAYKPGPTRPGNPSGRPPPRPSRTAGWR